jgi:hypothetical protein
VAARVVRHDFLGYGEALRTMAACDALVLVNSPDPADQIFVPGKLYDYVMAARPVLFFGDHGDAWNIVADTSGVECCFTHGEPGRAAAWLRDLVALGRPADRSPVAAYEPEASFAPLLQRLAAGADQSTPKSAKLR